MPGRRVGDKNAFWSAAVVGVGGTSAAVELPRNVGTLALLITVSAATTVSLQTVHPGDLTSEGVEPDTAETVWHDVFYIDTAVQRVFGSAGSACIVVPDAAFAHVRLKSSAAATITAGWLGMPE